MKTLLPALLIVLLSSAPAAGQGPAKKRPLGPTVNTTTHRELLPVISPDGQTLWFIREGLDTALGDRVLTKVEADLKTLEAQLEKLPPDQARDDQNKVIGFSRRNGNRWSAPPLLKIVGFAHQPGVRSDYFLAPNGRALILSIVNSESQNRSRDLFISLLQPDGRWARPIKMPTLNSPQEEISPWLAPDNQTMYFSSGRSGGLGENDIWMSRRLDDTWLKWSPPLNLGADINTKQADMNLAVDASGRMAFMSLGERGKEDLYEFELPAAMRPLPVAFVHGKVTDPAGKSIPAGILYEFLKNTQLAGQAGANPQDGLYQIALPIGEDYGFRASASGYIAISDRIDLRQAKDQQRYERNLVLIPIATGVPIRLNNIFFDTAKTELLPESRAELDRLAALLRETPTMRIEIRGHTDSLDDDATNQKLSDGRAAAVVTYLATVGIAAGRLQSRGLGESQPIAANDTEKNRLQNRRVEFVILSR